MRRHVRTVRRKRLAEILGDRDGIGAAIPGLACGVLGLAVALFGLEVARSRPPVRPASSNDVARVSSSAAAVSDVSPVVSAVSSAAVSSATSGGVR